MTAAPAYSRAERLLSVERVCLSYGQTKVLNDINARIDNLHRDSDASGATKTGQVVAFLGPSGCGKTSLLRILAGLQAPTSGRVLIGEKQTPVHAGLVGLVAQNYPLYRHRTVLGNLEIAARQKIGDRKAAWSAAYDILTGLALGACAQSYPSQISGGQRQRVAIGQQLLCSDHFLLMDEPTAGLDPLSKATVCRLISEVANRDDLETIIVVTHDVHSALLVADTLWLMGRLTTGGSTIVTEIDLAARGLAWHPELAETALFADAEREVLGLFKQL